MNLVKKMDLIGDQAIPGMPFLGYYLEEKPHWLGMIQHHEIHFYGNEESPQLERLATAQRVLPVLDVLELRARTAVMNHVSDGTDPFSDWALWIVYFGLDGTEPYDEFILDFCWGPWDCSTPIYAHYRLNSEHPEESTLLGFSGGFESNWCGKIAPPPAE